MNIFSIKENFVFSSSLVAFVCGAVAGGTCIALLKQNIGVIHASHLDNPICKSTLDAESSISKTQDAEIEKILNSLKVANGDEIPAFNMTNIRLQPYEALVLFDELLAECVREHKGNRAEAIAWIATRLVEGNDEAFLNVLAGDTIHDAKTLSQVEDILKSQGNKYWHQFTEGVLAQFALQNPQKGFLWLDNSKLEATARSSLSLHYVEKIVDGLLTKNTSEALDALNGIDCPDGISVAIRRSYYEKMARNDGEELWQTVIKPNTSPDVFCDAFESLFPTNPNKYADQLTASSITGEGRIKSEQILIHSWSNLAPKRAFEWLTNNRHLLKSQTPMSPLFESWARRDSLQASSALLQLEAGDDRDDAISGVVLGLYNSENDVAMRWLAQIADNEKRNTLENRLSKNLK
jgi:hypothetical protein